MHLLPGLLAGQRTGAVWLVAGPSPYDEGRGECYHEPIILTILRIYLKKGEEEMEEKK